MKAALVLVLGACGAPAPAPDAAPPALYAHSTELKARTIVQHARFGNRVALSNDGRTLAIGEQLDPSGQTGTQSDGFDDSTPAAGSVYIYTLGAAGWTFDAYIKPNVAGSGDQFGASLALSALGDRLVVGAPGEGSAATGVDTGADDNSASGSGAAYVFVRADPMASWAQLAYLKASNTGIGDEFGISVAIASDGNTVAVGAIQEDGADEQTQDAGAVYVFVTDGIRWSQEALVRSSAPHAIDTFGRAVALSADGATLAVGADGDDHDGVTDAGAVYVFARTVGTWAQAARVVPEHTGIGDAFGTSVALSGLGTTLVVGAPEEDSGTSDPADESAPDSGAAYVFARGESGWAQLGYLKAAAPEGGSGLGGRVAISADGATVATTDPRAFGVAGAVLGFRDFDGKWFPVATLTGSTGTDLFGASLALSRNGAVFAIGASLDDTGGDDSGAVYVYY